MRARKFGLSPSERDLYSYWPAYLLDPLRIPRKLALDDYKVQRLNGNHNDNPEHPFPHDGEYDWVSEKNIAYYLKLPPRPKHYRCRYTQGPKDKAWMEERDQNYLARRAREEAQQHDAGAGASSAASSPSP